MSPESSSHAGEIALLKHQLATAEDRLEKAQSFVFDLRCATARKKGEGFWMREKDISGLRAAVWSDQVDLGPWVLLKAQHVPDPTSSLTALFRNLASELGAPSSSLPSHPSALHQHFPPELFYHIVEHTSRSTNHALCLVSSSIRAIASPRLGLDRDLSSSAYTIPTQSATPDISLTLDKVLSLDVTIGHRDLSKPYPSITLPNLRHLRIRFGEGSYGVSAVVHIGIVGKLLSGLDPYSITFQRDFSASGFLWGVSRIHFLESDWIQATSRWTRLVSIEYVDCVRIHLEDEWYSNYEEDDLGAAIALSPSDLPLCDPSVALSWTFTENFGGYVQDSLARRNFSYNGYKSLMRLIVDSLSESPWPSVQSVGFGVSFRNEGEMGFEAAEEVLEANRDALKADLQKCPKEWRGWVHY